MKRMLPTFGFFNNSACCVFVIFTSCTLSSLLLQSEVFVHFFGYTSHPSIEGNYTRLCEARASASNEAIHKNRTAWQRPHELTVAGSPPAVEIAASFPAGTPRKDGRADDEAFPNNRPARQRPPRRGTPPQRGIKTRLCEARASASNEAIHKNRMARQKPANSSSQGVRPSVEIASPGAIAFGLCGVPQKRGFAASYEFRYAPLPSHKTIHRIVLFGRVANPAPRKDGREMSKQ